MKRVVVTGIGIVSSLGNNCREVLESLRQLKSGIAFDESYREMGLRSHVAGNIKIDTKEHIDRKILRFMGDAAAYAYIAMKEAIAHAGLTEEQVSTCAPASWPAAAAPPPPRKWKPPTPCAKAA